MKKSILAGLLAVTLLISFGCKKDDPVIAAGMTAKVAGNAWAADVATCSYSQTMNLTQITGMKGTMAEAIQLNLFGNTTGTYTISDSETSAIGGYVLNATAEGFYSTISADAPVGQIIITEYDQTNKTVSGTFQFEAYNLNGAKISITEGKFTKVALLVTN